jgi:hypothetical protein
MVENHAFEPRKTACPSAGFNEYLPVETSIGIRVITSRMSWTGNVRLTGEMRDAYRTLVVKPEGERLLGRRRCRWEDNVRMDLKEI